MLLVEYTVWPSDRDRKEATGFADTSCSVVLEVTYAELDPLMRAETVTMCNEFSTNAEAGIVIWVEVDVIVVLRAGLTLQTNSSAARLATGTHSGQAAKALRVVWELARTPEIVRTWPA
jgi:hypothetical protein